MRGLNLHLPVPVTRLLGYRDLNPGPLITCALERKAGDPVFITRSEQTIFCRNIDSKSYVGVVINNIGDYRVQEDSILLRYAYRCLV